jgi:hypothetical protein
MAKNLDANLAEVDMEDFRTEDIHSILTTLPAMCCGELQVLAVFHVIHELGCMLNKWIKYVLEAKVKLFDL